MIVRIVAKYQPFQTDAFINQPKVRNVPKIIRKRQKNVIFDLKC